MLLILCCTLLVPASAPAPPRPKLVVVITVDQLRPDYLDRWKTQLTGGLFRLVNEGAVFTDAYQDHAVTETAPGHATVLSGLWPAHNGIIRNAQGVQDSAAVLLGVPGGGPGASPRRFRGTTVFDWLRAAAPGSRALSVSVKDRGAILPLGTAKANVYWLSFRTGQFTTSRYYADSLPRWVQAFNARTRAPAAWTLLLPDSAYPEPDDEPWENGGGNRTFPHAVAGACTTVPSVACAATPALDSVTLELAWAGMEALRLGRSGGGRTDLLAVSLSVTDFIGHAYGPDSREIHDQVLRLDRYLGWFLKRVLDRVGRDNVVVVLTADHGVTPFPERTRAQPGAQAYRVNLDTLVTGVNRELDRTLSGGTREWLGFDSGMLFLQDNGRFAATGVKTDSILDAVAARMRAVAGVGRVDRVADLARADTASDPVARRWLHHLPADAGVVLVVTLQPGSVWRSEPPIAMHGQPSEDDAHVPLIFWGRAVKRGIYRGRVNTVDIAPTLGRVLGVPPLSLIDGRVLTDALAPRD